MGWSLTGRDGGAEAAPKSSRAAVGLTGCLRGDGSNRPVYKQYRRATHAAASSRGEGESWMAVDLSMSVLVVDDYNTMIRIIRNLLKQLGFQNIDDDSDG